MEKEIENLLTRDEVCKVLRISIPTFYRLVRSGRLPAARIASEWRVRPSVLNRYIDRQTVKPYRRVEMSSRANDYGVSKNPSSVY